MEKAVGHAMEKYLRNDSEQKRESQAETRPDSETPPNLHVDLEGNRLVETGLASIEKAPDSTEAPAPAEPQVEISQEANLIDKGPELYDIPIADLELLLVELNANPLEVQPERNIEAEPAREQ